MVNGLRSFLVVNVVPSARTCVIVAHAITVLAGATGQSEVMPGSASVGSLDASTYAMSPRPRIFEQPEASRTAQAASTRPLPRRAPSDARMIRWASYTPVARAQTRTERRGIDRWNEASS